MADDKSKAEQVEIKQQLSSKEEEFYWSRHDGSSPEKRKQLEKEWNELKSKEASSENKEWTYKIDRRDDTQLEKTETKNRQTEVTGHSVDAKVTVHDPSTTINWRRDTEYGKNREDNTIRPSISRGTGDDAGHLSKAEWGADPEGVNAGRVDRNGIDPTTGEKAERLNYGRQNWKMNQGEGYKNFEDEITQHARTGDGPVDVTVHAETNNSRFGGEREQHRTIRASREVDGKRQPLSHDNVTMVNFPTARQRAAEGTSPDPEPQETVSSSAAKKTNGPRPK